MEKQFYCTWSDSDKKAMNSYNHSERVVKADFFSEDNGYTTIDLDAINQLKKGEVYNCEYGNHKVERVQ